MGDVECQEKTIAIGLSALEAYQKITEPKPEQKTVIAGGYSQAAYVEEVQTFGRLRFNAV